MNNEEKRKKIDQLIGDREDLKCNLLYSRSLAEVESILGMPEWQDKKFSKLLTSTY